MNQIHAQYPWSTVVIASGLSLAIYAIGAYVISGWGWLWTAGYLLFCAGVVFNVLRNSCRNCYYYGKRCGMSLGKICSLLLKPGDPAVFAKKEVTWIQVLPDMLVTLIPLLAGGVLLIRNFSWMILFLLIILLGLSFGGNALVRGRLLCIHCKQRELGCPAEKLFRQQKASPTC